jgi:predicted transcriptional regulator
MSTAQLIAEYKSLSVVDRQKVAEAILADESWIPESFREGMCDIESGRVVPMDAALSDKPPGSE